MISSMTMWLNTKIVTKETIIEQVTTVLADNLLQSLIFVFELLFRSTFVDGALLGWSNLMVGPVCGGSLVGGAVAEFGFGAGKDFKQGKWLIDEPAGLCFEEAKLIEMQEMKSERVDYQSKVVQNPHGH
ncbi:hypothetical protein V6N11_042345 [Hibiscus sabdariffa]|uniref:Uncharacterized protein n=1 Tax=Hibiscus sabdariffa TaxID=183260 RepID=A0ABR2QW53_9ROSI